MDKETAAELFGSQADMARELGISRQAVCLWPPRLNRRQVHEVVGALLLSGRIKSIDEVPPLQDGDGAAVQSVA